MLESRIEELILKSGYKKSFVAEKLEITVKQLRNYETGRNYMRIDKAYILADLLGVGVEELYERKPN
ncbi:helix-turn-helix transcriptional regulator [Bacillus sp. 7884-1]|uniref:helix-turn-helix transcriptional regulator n=1 Tax=Bacillus sp. 7884-1 TaxID=2021693 RepID=UPI00211C14C7|nr:helix-turn-helix transcriptional regulator [Bacillus sp. 7884-1]